MEGRFSDEASESETRGGRFCRIVVSVRLTCIEGSTEVRHPWYYAVGSATDVGALFSGHHRLAAGHTLIVPGCRAFRLLLPEYVGLYRMVEVATGAGLGALDGTDVCARGAATLGEGIAPAQLPCGVV